MYLSQGHTHRPQHLDRSVRFLSACFMSSLIWSIPSSIRLSCSESHKHTKPSQTSLFLNLDVLQISFIFSCLFLYLLTGLTQVGAEEKVSLINIEIPQMHITRNLSCVSCFRLRSSYTEKGPGSDHSAQTS